MEPFREGTDDAAHILETVHTTADDNGKYTFTTMCGELNILPMKIKKTISSI